MKIEDFFNQQNVIELSFFNFENAITAAYFARVRGGPSGPASRCSVFLTIARWALVACVALLRRLLRLRGVGRNISEDGLQLFSAAPVARFSR